MEGDLVIFSVNEFNKLGEVTPVKRFQYLLSLASSEFAENMKADKQEANAYFTKYYKGYSLEYNGRCLSLFNGQVANMDTVSVGEMTMDTAIYTDNLYNLISHMSSTQPTDELNENMDQMKLFFEGGLLEMISKASYMMEVERRKKIPIMIISPSMKDLRFMISKEYRSLYVHKQPWAEQRLHSFIDDEMKGKISKTFSEISYPEEVIVEEDEYEEDEVADVEIDLEL